MGRFLNADDLGLLAETGGDITDKNLYNYCDNNPIMRADSGGEFWNFAVGFAIGAGISIASEIASQAIEGNGFNIGAIVVAGVGGGATAALGPFAGAAVSGLTSAATNYIKGERNIKTIAYESAVSVCFSFAGSAGSKSLSQASDKWVKKGASSVFNKIKNCAKRKKPSKQKDKLRNRLKSRGKKFINKQRRTKANSRWQSESALSSIYSGYHHTRRNAYRKYR